MIVCQLCGLEKGIDGFGVAKFEGIFLSLLKTDETGVFAIANLKSHSITLRFFFVAVVSGKHAKSIFLHPNLQAYGDKFFRIRAKIIMLLENTD